MIHKVGRLCLLTQSPDKNLLSRTSYHPILSAKIEHVLSLTILLADFVCRSTNFVYVTIVIVYNGR